MARYRQLTADDNEPTPWLRVRFKYYALFVCSLPCVAFAFCVAYSLARNFQSATATTCGAYNILPSISAAIGGYSPQKEVWKSAVLLTFLPRILLIRDYVQYHLNLPHNRHHLVLLLAVLNFMENCALVSLSFYDSTFNYNMHKHSFIIFIIASEAYMLILIGLNHSYKLNASELKGLRLKKRLAATNIIGILLAMYYFIDHNINCGDFTYSKFAFCEYIVVFSNIAFHTTIIYDFQHRYVVFAPSYLIKMEDLYGRSRLPLVNV